MSTQNPKGMETFYIEMIDGVPYPRALESQDIAKQHALIKDLDLRPDDVIVVGIPKAGNHWTFELVSMIVKQSAEYEKDQMVSHMLDYTGLNMPEKIAKFESPRVLTMHAFIQHLPRQVVEKKVKIIFLVRNPKDLWVSAYHMYSTMDYKQLHFSASWEDFFRTRMRGEFVFDSWFANVKGVEKFMAEHPDVPVYASHFEKNKLDPIGAIQDLSQFLHGKPLNPNLAEKIAEAASFSRMKERLDGGKMGDVKELLFNKEIPTGIMRKGVVGDWKTMFTVAQSEEFDLLFEKEMAGSKIGDIVRPYISI